MELPAFILKTVPGFRLNRLIKRYSLEGNFRGLCQRVAITSACFGAIFAWKVGSPIKYYYMRTQPTQDLMNDPFYEKYWYKYKKPAPEEDEA